MSLLGNRTAFAVVAAIFVAATALPITGTGTTPESAERGVHRAAMWLSSRIPDDAEIVGVLYDIDKLLQAQLSSIDVAVHGPKRVAEALSAVGLSRDRIRNDPGAATALADFMDVVVSIRATETASDHDDLPDIDLYTRIELRYINTFTSEVEHRRFLGLNRADIRSLFQETSFEFPEAPSQQKLQDLHQAIAAKETQLRQSISEWRQQKRSPVESIPGRPLWESKNTPQLDWKIVSIEFVSIGLGILSGSRFGALMLGLIALPAQFEPGGLFNPKTNEIRVKNPETQQLIQDRNHRIKEANERLQERINRANADLRTLSEASTLLQRLLSTDAKRDPSDQTNREVIRRD